MFCSFLNKSRLSISTFKRYNCTTTINNNNSNNNVITKSKDTYIYSKKVRQHTNPLGINFQNVIESPNWSEIYEDLSKPFTIDLGTGQGEMCLKRSIGETKFNILGIDIRKIYIDVANQVKQIHIDKSTTTSIINTPTTSSLLSSPISQTQKPIKNLHYLCCNVNVNINNIGESINKLNNNNKSNIEEISIFFPDPHYKKRHNKRRLINQELISNLYKISTDNVKVYIQTDNQQLFDDISEQFTESNLFTVNYYHNNSNNEMEPPNESIWNFPKSHFENYFKSNSNKSIIHKVIYIKK